MNINNFPSLAEGRTTLQNLSMIKNTELLFSGLFNKKV